MKRRNKALTVLISFVPGAGQMFQGFMNTGVIIMILFFGVIFLSEFFDLYIMNLALPIIWCYAFFDSLNKMNHDDEEFKNIKDEIPFDLSPIKKMGVPVKIAAILLIAAGTFSIWNIIYNQIQGYVYGTSLVFATPVYILTDILGYFPRIVIGIIVIAVGIRLISKKKKELKEDDTDNS